MSPINYQMVESSSTELDITGFEIGLYFLVGIAQFFIIALKIRGKPWRLQAYLASRDFQILQNPSHQRCFNWILTVTIHLICLLPFVALIIWGLIHVDWQRDRDEKPTIGTTIILVGFSLFFFVFGMMKISWNNYRLTKTNMISILLAMVLFTAFQFIITMMDESEEDNFFGYSSMFLTINCFFVIFIIFINATAEGANIRMILDSLEEGAERDKFRDDDFKEEIAEEWAKDDYLVKRQDILDLFTIGSIPKKLGSAFGGGIQKLFTDMNPAAKKTVTTILYLLSLGIMAIYSWVIYSVMDDSYLGVLTSIAVVVTDIILFLYHYSGLSSSPAILAFKAIISRFLLIVYGDNYWIYGYFTLYLYYTFVLSYKIAVKRFPFEEQYLSMNLDTINGSKTLKVDVSRIPEFLIGFITAVLLLLITTMAWVKPNNVPLSNITIMEKSFTFKQIGALTILIGGLFYFLICTLRIFIRKRRGIRPSKVYFVLLERFDTYWLFWVGSYLLIACVVLFLYYANPSPAMAIIGLIGSLALICFLNTLLYYDLNDYNILQDIEALNKKIELKNKQMEKLNQKMEKVKADLASGNTNAIGAQSAGLAANLLKGEELKKKQKELEAKSPHSPISKSPVQRSLRFGKDGTIKKSPTNSPTIKKKKNDSYMPPAKPSKVVVVNDDDEIYEGGEPEENKEEQKAHDAAKSSAAQMAANFKKKLVFDWKLTGGNSIGAFFKGELRYNDYQIIISFIMSIVLFIVMAIALCAEYESTWGITVTVPCIHYMLAVLALSRHLNTDFPLAVWEIIMLTLSFIIQYAWGIIYFRNNLYDAQEVKEDESFWQGEFLIVYLVLIPFITSFVAGILKFIDDQGKLSIMFWILFSISCVQIVGMIAISGYFMDPWVTIVLICILIFVIWMSVNIYIFKKNNGRLPKMWRIINLIIFILIYCALFGATFYIDDFSNFAGFSIIILGTAALLMSWALNKFRKNIANIDRKPIFFSPWIFPIYRFSCKKNDVILYNGPTIVLLSSLLLVLVWAILAAAFLKPYWIGICISILIEITLVVTALYLISISSIQLAAMLPFVDEILLKNAWMESKKAYIRDRGAFSRASLLTYIKQRDRRNDFREFIRLNKEKGGPGKQILFPEGKDMDWIDEEDVNLGSFMSQLNYSFEQQRLTKKAYMEELQLVVYFQLMIISQANQLQAFERKYLFKFIKEKKAELFCLGIQISVPDEGSEAVRYARVITMIQKLKADQQTMFNNLREHYIEEERKREEEQKELARIAEEKERERQERLNEMSKAKQELLKNLDLTLPLDQIPDCKEKYKKIVDENNSFTDTKFPADESSLGDNVKNRVGGWKRASEVATAKLFDGQINYQDITQGMLGDCYFLSAMSVLPERAIRDMIIKINHEEEWRKVGAFCVCFYKNGHAEYVIIDDFFPTLPNGEWAFVKGGSNKNELWPMVLEKAYAKLNGSYAYIEAGKVQYALADMTDGFPEQIDLKKDVKNTETLWENLISIQKHGGLMGAGSPEHALGDTAISDEGIVQGHAYAILQLVNVDGNKLLQLRNPHGSVGVEWSGDWSDESMKWSKRLKTKLKLKAKNDGVFWMSLDDFIENFSYLYVCRILNAKTGWTGKEESGWWRGKTAEGLPSKANPKARLDRNPQFEIRVTKPCNGFISLLQKDQINMFKGKHNIFFMVSSLEGDYIKKVDKSTMVCRSGAPINLNVISAECDFPANLSYPYVFTVLVANTKQGEEGTGEFKLSVYSTDPKMTLKAKPAK